MKEFGGMMPQDFNFPMKDGVEERYVLKEFHARYFDGRSQVTTGHKVVTHTCCDRSQRSQQM
jgi:hypothetical protein